MFITEELFAHFDEVIAAHYHEEEEAKQMELFPKLDDFILDQLYKQIFEH
jgi:hypothetical protein